MFSVPFYSSSLKSIIFCCYPPQPVLKIGHICKPPFSLQVKTKSASSDLPTPPGQTKQVLQQDFISSTFSMTKPPKFC